ncbi:cytochrome c [Luteolibacter pohnpeiensis]|uniref:Cytochrome c n=1 Tax=Luteolibacter pohnpeiensis TaxID=454153 RepID=A0A934S5H5_9BACT|nr:cytochrome c [Luteolibacter pohnpeiensis]MBK1881625.1 cytochrome c [Luteolibacter pohnpeiensis]
MKYFIFPALLGLLSMGAIPAASGEAKTIELPVPESATYKQIKGVDLAMSYCYTCHSAEYAASQPPLPRTFWAGTVAKMRDKFGAPIPDSVVEDLTDYLTAAYGTK